MTRPALLAAALLLLAPLLAGFASFTRVKSVCPTCPPPPQDVLTLSNGFKVRGHVVAQNEQFYVVERFGEQRAVMKTEVGSVEWREHHPPVNLTAGDQILLRDGSVLHGRIVEERLGQYFKIEVAGLSHIVWVALINGVFKSGLPYNFSSP